VAQEKNESQSNSEQARELLSAYLDGEVTATEQALVEHALAASSELREDLDTLRQTITLIVGLPKVAAPRPFTLSEADIGPAARPKAPSLPAWMSSWAMLTAALVCVVAGGGLFLSGTFPTPPSEVALAPQPIESRATEAEEDLALMAQTTGTPKSFKEEVTAESDEAAPAPDRRAVSPAPVGAAGVAPSQEAAAVSPTPARDASSAETTILPPTPLPVEAATPAEVPTFDYNILLPLTGIALLLFAGLGAWLAKHKA
jgi:anti-sigma factor RsiW